MENIVTKTQGKTLQENIREKNIVPKAQCKTLHLNLSVKPSQNEKSTEHLDANAFTFLVVDIQLFTGESCLSREMPHTIQYQTAFHEMSKNIKIMSHKKKKIDR